MNHVFTTIKQIKSWDHVLPGLLVLLTGKSRYLPEIEWSDELWTHNVFRVYEMIFWRRQGLRAESLAMTNGKTYLFTFEAVCAYVEAVIRREFAPIRIIVMQTANVPMLDARFAPYMFSIAIDTTASGGAGYSQTVSGSQRGMAICKGNREADEGTATATYDSVSATFVIGSRNGTTNNGNLAHLFKLIAPNTGSHTVSFSYSGAAGGSISFTGADQTTLVGNTASGFTGVQNGVSYSLTISRANSYSVESQWGQSTNAFSEDQSQTQWGGSTVSGQRYFAAAYKSHGTTGSKTLGFGSGLSQVWDYATGEFMEFVATANGNFFAFVLP